MLVIFDHRLLWKSDIISELSARKIACVLSVTQMFQSVNFLKAIYEWCYHFGKEGRPHWPWVNRLLFGPSNLSSRGKMKPREAPWPDQRSHNKWEVESPVKLNCLPNLWAPVFLLPPGDSNNHKLSGFWILALLSQDCIINKR